MGMRYSKIIEENITRKRDVSRGTRKKVLEKINPYEYIKCPLCESGDNLFGTCDLGSCDRCGCVISSGSQSYCYTCSVELKACFWCGEEIISGNDYIPKIEKIFQERKNSCRFLYFDNNGESVIKDVSRGSQDGYKDYCEELDKKFAQMCDKYRNKSIDEVFELCKYRKN